MPATFIGCPAMPFTINLDHERRLIEVKWCSEVTDEESLEVGQRLLSTPELSVDYQIFHDVSDIHSFRVTGEGLYRLAILVEPITNPTAVLVSADGFIQGMVMTYQAIVNWNRSRLRVFTTEAEALEWLAGQMHPARQIDC